MITGNEIFSNPTPESGRESARRFREARQFLGISIEQLAIFLETSSDNIKKVEQGKLLIPTQWVYTLSKFFGINANWLISGSQFITKSKTQAYGELIKLMQVPQVEGAINYQLSLAQCIFKNQT